MGGNVVFHGCAVIHKSAEPQQGSECVTSSVSHETPRGAQLCVKDGLKSSRQTWECASVSPCEMETMLVPFSALVVTELLCSAQESRS